ncbi:helix-turn-helix domain-containing protein [Schleiferilactobacillus harbinensis]|uniref:Transcriptional regulator, AraC family n=1 Tax=Schleiferilactobacillus harbinensis DSM 16991 TaxID=1122147 RepID=A0A0R1XKT9_9LACO|nr:helix-turn-helix transcriptional regulator [Schleiferilactobacillus harbinensis]KRM27356.1 transcriptional regulator, AraC family [Schleiferilactobacillus harbinensis DSM 16991]QFR63058.1 helix-turn-helix domain-containing protein [Schleiferilactobacillus harbinensis]
MQYLNIPLKTPVQHIRSGQFNADLGWRHHRFIHRSDTEILIGLAGRVDVNVAGTDYTLAAGDVLTVFPHETIVGTRGTLIPSRFFWCHFIAPTQVSTRPMRQIAVLPRFFHLRDLAKVFINIQQVLDVAHNEYYLAQAADYQTTMLIIELANRAWAARQNVTGDHTQIKEWIRTHMNESLTVGAIADHFNLNPDYMTRIFKRETGMPVIEFLNSVRLDYARYLLLTTTDTVHSICHQSFFNDAKYFSRIFKKKFHLTPSAYRTAYTHTFVNNQQVDPGGDINQYVALIEKSQKENSRH